MRADPLTLTVRDNGVGLPADLDFEATTSLGLQLVRTLAHQLGGVAEWVPGVGTKIRVTAG
jgi:two-component sensor histidine kinase